MVRENTILRHAGGHVDFRTWISQFRRSPDVWCHQHASKDRSLFMHPTSAPRRRHARAVARRAAAPQSSLAGAVGIIVLLMLAWGSLLATGLGIH
jgi:hypothetical protein